MKGFIRATLACLSLTAGLLSVAGCHSPLAPGGVFRGQDGCGTCGGCGGCGGCEGSCEGGSCCQNRYYRCTDPCWPQRYSVMASDSVRHAMGAQVNNGRVLEQTVWNEYFEEGTPKLNGYGQSRLEYLARRRPHPDCKLYLQTAHDIRYDAELPPDEFARHRDQLDLLRMKSVRHYLDALTANRPVAWEVTVHDPAPVGMPALLPIYPGNFMQKSIQERGDNLRGTFIVPIAGGGATGGPQ